MLTIQFNSVLHYMGLGLYILGTVLYIKSIVDYAKPAAGGILGVPDSVADPSEEEAAGDAAQPDEAERGVRAQAFDALVGRKGHLMDEG